MDHTLPILISKFETINLSQKLDCLHIACYVTSIRTHEALRDEIVQIIARRYIKILSTKTGGGDRCRQVGGLCKLILGNDSNIPPVDIWRIQYRTHTTGFLVVSRMNISMGLLGILSARPSSDNFNWNAT